MRIVQLTDLHLSPDLGDARWLRLQEQLAALDSRRAAIDRVVLTGDLATHGQRAVYFALRALLIPFIDKLRVLPGNHDDRKLIREIFEDRFKGGPGANFVDPAQDLRLIGLDTSRPGRVSGKLGKEQLAWLKAVLSLQIPTLIFMHHPPLKVGTWWLDKDILRDRREFETALQPSAVRGVFCGHVHQAFQGNLGRVPVWTTPSTAYQFAPGSWIPRPTRAPAAHREIEFSSETLHSSLIAW
jgi:3',5'-cyclic AMP phosphodiesterase CpdA